MTTSFKDIEAWRTAHAFVLEVYKTTKTYPNDELFGLTSQFRRASISIAANIAEGYKKKGKADKLRFYNISQGSLEECRYYILLSYELGYIPKAQFETIDKEIETCSKLLNNYYRAIAQSMK